MNKVHLNYHCRVAISFVTSEIWTVRKTCGDLTICCDDVNDTFLYEIHFGSHGALSYNVVSGLEHLESHHRNITWVVAFTSRSTHIAHMSRRAWITQSHLRNITFIRR